MSFIKTLIEEKYLKSREIISAFERIKRVDFLPPEIKNLAHLNEALPIGYGQTISQPLVVAFMLELLKPEKGEKILDIGSGSGWTTALLAQIVSDEKIDSKPRSRVVAIELIPELKEFGEKNIGKYNFIKKGIVKCLCGNGSRGYKKEAPYDKILVSASAGRVSDSWKKELKVGGRMVVPLYNSIWLFIKKNEKEFEEKEYPGFVFVPLIDQII